MNKNDVINDAAQLLWEASEQRNACEPVRNLIGVDDLSLAYAVQKVNIDRRFAAGEQPVGVKVGLTSKVVQEQLGVDQPDFGVLTDRMEVKLGDEVPWHELFQPKAEAEVAFKLSKDLPAAKIDMETLKASIEGAAASIEIVGSRIKDWNIRITDTIADNASASHFVVSDRMVPLEGLDLEGCEMQLHQNGALVSEGKGAACLGSPFNAALWLVNTWAEIGMPLKKGYWILAGALGPMAPVLPGDVFEASIDGLGAVKVKFGNEK
jgi:2-keto-4-pentenoate hydratase